MNARELAERVTGAPGFMRLLGVRVVAAEPGLVELAIDKRPDLLQAHGFFHGGVICALADHAAGGAVTTALPPGRFAVTINLETHFLEPARGAVLGARARVLRVGTTVSVACVDLFIACDGAEAACATALATVRVVDAPEVARG